MYKHYQRNKDSISDEKVIRFKKVRNRINSLKVQLKSDYYNRVAQDCVGSNSNCTRELYNKLGVLVNKRVKSRVKCTSIKHGEEIITDTPEIARYFNEFFTHVARNMQGGEDDVTTTEDRHRRADTVFYNQNTYVHNKVTLNEVCNIVSELSPRKAPGPDQISNGIIKAIFP